MSDSAFVSHVVSQTRENIDFLQAQGYLTVDDAASIRSKLTETTGKTSGRSANAPAFPSPSNNQVSTYKPHPPQPPRPTPSYPRARALWAYNKDGMEPGDLVMSVGDVIEIVEETNADWWTGRNKGEQGLFPSSYVERLSPGHSPQPFQEKMKYGAPGYNDHANHPPPRQTNAVDDTPVVNSVGLQPDEGQGKKKKKFGPFGNTIAHSAAGGLGFGAGAAVGGGIINALF